MAAIAAVVSTAVITAAPATLDTVTLSEGGKAVEVTNLGTTNRLSFRVDGTAAVADAAENHHVPPGGSLQVPSLRKPDVIKVISTGGTTYCVTGVQS